MSVDWSAMKTEAAASSDVIYGLPLRKEDGNLTDKGMPGTTGQMEFVDVNVDPQPKFPDPKGRPTLIYNFKDLSQEGKPVVFTNAQGTRFFNAMAGVQPQPGDIIKVQRTGTGFQTNYKVELVKKGEGKPAPQQEEQKSPQQQLQEDIPFN